MIDPIIIGISGYKGSGKDTAASYLKGCFPYKEFPYVKRIGFADPIKRELCKKLEVSMDWLEERKNIPEIRGALQRLGEEGRKKDLNYWISKLLEGITTPNGEPKKEPPIRRVILIPDVRHHNEIEFIRSKKGFSFRVERKGQVNTDTHESEIHVGDLKVDWIIHNDQTVIKLRNDIRWLFVDMIMPHFSL